MRIEINIKENGYTIHFENGDSGDPNSCGGKGGYYASPVKPAMQFGILSEITDVLAKYTDYDDVEKLRKDCCVTPTE